ncbi:MAG: AAA family ATPase [Blautia obeum]|nr:AAA family ATPase [Blautia obeum]
MEARKKKLPIGIENFEEIRTKGFYYVDKTGLIKELFENWGKVTLFTRPRRFGKSLNMSMLKSFFEPGGRKEIFEGLAISKEISLCEEYMGKFPVISISLKGIDAGSFDTARELAVQIVNGEARRFQYLLDSERLTSYDKDAYTALLRADMSEAVLYGSLKVLSELLEKHYERKVILLIDEYDVPLSKAFDQGYYDQMIVLIRNLFQQALKTNDSLEFAVLTGCMRISKESIFTGLNNLRVLSVVDVEFDEYFGFTDEEVKELLEHYNLSKSYETVKEWYDGYQFGNVEVYCPWDVICHCSKLCKDSNAQPQNYWSNTSSNDAVKKFIQGADIGTTKNEIEKLVAGGIIQKEIRQELTYKDMYSSIDNIWSVLFTTGYLTLRGQADRKRFYLAIPNLEIREIYTEQIMELFKENIKKNGDAVNAFCDALQNGDVEKAEKGFSDYLRKTISIRDTFVKKPMKENFYHGILLGLLGYKDTWIISSNEESGDGYSDILVRSDDEEIGIVIEVKYAEDGRLEEACKEALEQIESRRYEEELQEEGIRHILKYGIACYKKRCKVLVADAG